MSMDLFACLIIDCKKVFDKVQNSKVMELLMKKDLDSNYICLTGNEKLHGKLEIKLHGHAKKGMIYIV